MTKVSVTQPTVTPSDTPKATGRPPKVENVLAHAINDVPYRVALIQGLIAHGLLAKSGPQQGKKEGLATQIVPQTNPDGTLRTETVGSGKLRGTQMVNFVTITPSDFQPGTYNGEQVNALQGYKPVEPLHKLISEKYKARFTGNPQHAFGGALHDPSLAHLTGKPGKWYMPVDAFIDMCREVVENDELEQDYIQ